MSSSDENDAGAPLPNFNTSSIQMHTIAPSLGVVGGKSSPDYLDYDPKGRGIVVTMFANAGMSYLLGTTAGGLYGFRQGLAATPSNRFRVQLNSVLNHSGRYGSRAGNTLGVFAILYSVFEGFADNVSKISVWVCGCDLGTVFGPLSPSICVPFFLLPPTSTSWKNSWASARYLQQLLRSYRPPLVLLVPVPLTLHRRGPVWRPWQDRLGLEPSPLPMQPMVSWAFRTEAAAFCFSNWQRVRAQKETHIHTHTINYLQSGCTGS
jgi:hypothetical protein